MPQDSLRSVVYRSLVTCDDPKGVADCKTIRKSKQKIKKTSPSPSKEELCYQVMEVSRGLGKLEKASDLKHNMPHDEKPRVSASRDCYDELREVIRESFARQNLLPKERVGGDVDRKHSDLCVDLPSSSSSQTSSSSIRHEKTKGSSNLIAKLMGLEGVPSSKAAVLKERVPYRKSPFLDIDLPRPNKPQLMVVRERRTLEEIIETMQFKGILGSDCKYHSNALFLRKDSLADDDSPPIVIMRPHCINGGEHIKKQMPRKMREEIPPRPQLKPKQKLDRSKVGVRPALDSLPTTKMSQSKPLLPQIYKKEAPKIRKLPAQTKDAKPEKTQDLAKLSALKHSKTVRGNNVSKSQIARPKVAAADKGMKSLNRAVPKKSPRKGESNSKPSSALVENTHSDGNFAINIETIISESLVKNTEPEQNTEEVAKAYYMSDNSTNATKDESNHIEDDSCIPSFESDQIKGYKSIMKSRYLLLSSVSFLNHIEELFDTGTHDSTAFQTDCEELRDSLLLDCAKEIVERKSLSCRSMRNQWSQNLLRRPKYHLSMEQLVGEISDIIEDIQNYSKCCGDTVVADSIYPMLDRDLWRNEEVTGAWDSGWRKGYTMEAVDEVMHDVEEQVLSEIVADVIIEIM